MLEIKNLSVTYKSKDKEILRDISLSVSDGEVIAILGASGCGKTTLLKRIANLLSKKEADSDGEIITFNNEIRFVFQEPLLLPWLDVKGNVIFGLRADKNKIVIKEDVDNIISLIGLSDYKNYYPHQLSLGMQQRINFARALICNPKIMLLDEPFSSLDGDTKLKLMKDFYKIIKDKKITTIFVTHNVEEAKYLADRVMFLSDNNHKITKIIDKNKLDEHIFEK